MIPTITINHATLSYAGKTIFADLNLTLPAGKWLGLLGSSGIGKSSLLRMLAGLTQQQENIAGEMIADNHIPLNQQVAYMAQTDLLLPWLTVIENATISLKLRRHTITEQAEKTHAATSLLSKVGLSNSLNLYPKQLSGGMRQRVALVRTLLENKPVVLMDEPFSALDAITRYKLQELAADMLRNKTVLFVTHDPTEALRLADEIYIMQGSPTVLKLVAQLSSTTPRELTDPDVIKLQAKLFHELSDTGNNS